MTMTTALAGSTFTVTLCGDIDSNTAYQPYEAVVAAFDDAADGAIRLVVIDVADVGFTDSTAIGTLVRINGHTIEQRARCEIRNAPLRLLRLLQMTGLDTDLNLT